MFPLHHHQKRVMIFCYHDQGGKEGLTYWLLPDLSSSGERPGHQSGFPTHLKCESESVEVKVSKCESESVKVKVQRLHEEREEQEGKP